MLTDARWSKCPVATCRARESQRLLRTHRRLTGRLVRDSEQGHQLLVRNVDVEVLKSRLFTSDIVGALNPLLDAEPDVRIYKAA